MSNCFFLKHMENIVWDDNKNFVFFFYLSGFLSQSSQIIEFNKIDSIKALIET